MDVVEALTYWQHHLQTAYHGFTVQTDHCALLYYCSPHLLMPRQACWLIELSCFCFQYEFVKGKDNHLANSLSRNPALYPDTDVVAAFNTHTTIPSEAVKLDPSPPNPGPLPITDSSCPILALLKNPEPSPTSLGEQVLLAQPLSLEYPSLIKLAASNGNITPQGYQENTCILLHIGKWWVPEGPLH
ncbi:hypothetical protein DSO57_1023640 [Entomophthora muscae]|uniref:Uncharacterized protein n=1 Tax=Entomophthora muscae TaxID=34485 RepID=A0ACC2RHG8_9FUNG|nr:hypothetical protein DSO57_1023640 [Entomophthora muscae]